jgi:HEAT repeat protein
MTRDFETKLRGVILDSATKRQQREAKANVELLLSKGVHSIRDLIELAQNSRLKAGLRSVACWALGQLQNPDAVPALLNVVERASPQICWEAAKSLVVLLRNGHKGTRKLKQALHQGRGPHNRAGAAYVLGLTGNRASIPLLVEVLQSADTPDVRSHAAEALGNIGELSTTDSLVSALRDRSPRVRLAAAYALGEAANERAIAPLKRLALAKPTSVSQSALVRAEAKKAISRIQHRKRSIR